MIIKSLTPFFTHNARRRVFAITLFSIIAYGSTLLFGNGIFFYLRSANADSHSATVPVLRLKSWGLKAVYDENTKKVTGVFSLQNISDSFGDDLHITASILSKDEDIIYDRQALPENISIAAREVLNQKISYTPAFTPGGEHKLRIEISSGQGRDFDWVDALVQFPDGRNGLILSGQNIRMGAHIIGPEEGPTISADVDAKFLVTISNRALKNISASPAIEVREFSAYGAIAKTEKGDFEIFSPDTILKKAFKIPAVDKPGAYVASLRYVNESNEIISGVAEFRWVVPGTSARILSIAQEGDSFLPPSGITFAVAIAGPADFFSGLDNASLVYKLTERNGKIILEGREKLPDFTSGGVQTAVFTITSDKKIESPELAISVVNGEDKTVSAYSMKPSVSPDTRTIPLWLIGAFLIALSALVAVGYIAWNYFKKPSEIVAAILIAGTIGGLSMWYVIFVPGNIQAFNPGGVGFEQLSIINSKLCFDSACVSEVPWDPAKNAYIIADQGLPYYMAIKTKVGVCGNTASNIMLSAFFDQPTMLDGGSVWGFADFYSAPVHDKAFSNPPKNLYTSPGGYPAPPYEYRHQASEPERGYITDRFPMNKTIEQPHYSVNLKQKHQTDAGPLATLTKFVGSGLVTSVQYLPINFSSVKNPITPSPAVHSLRVLAWAHIVHFSIHANSYLWETQSPPLNVIFPFTASACGNGTAEGAEECDGSDLRGNTCQNKGFDAGSVTCSSTCTLNASACTAKETSVTPQIPTLPNVACSVTPPTTQTGGLATWTAGVPNDSGPYSFAWNGSPDPNPLDGKTGNPVAINYSTPGLYAGQVRVTSNNGLDSGWIECGGTGVADLLIQQLDVTAEPPKINPGECTSINWDVFGFDTCQLFIGNPATGTATPLDGPTIGGGTFTQGICPLSTTEYCVVCDGAITKCQTITLTNLPGFDEIPP